MQAIFICNKFWRKSRMDDSIVLIMEALRMVKKNTGVK